MRGTVANRTGVVGALAVVLLFVLNELSVIVFGPTMFYVLCRVAIVPLVGLLYIVLTGYQIVRRRERGVTLLTGVVGMVCIFGVILFQFIASFPAAKYLGFFAG